MGWTLEQVASVVTIVGLPVAVFALGVGYRQLKLARRAASSQTLVSLFESFRQAWIRLAAAPDEEKHLALPDVMNLVELACAVVNDGVMAKRTGDVLVEFLCHQIVHFERHELTRQRISEMQQTTSTFVQIQEFMKRNSKKLNECRGKLNLQETLMPQVVR